MKRIAAVVLFLPLFAGRPAAQEGAGLVELNAELARLWADHGRPGVERALASKIEALQGRTFARGGTKVTVLDVRPSEFQLLPPPGFEEFRADRVRIRLPLATSWQIRMRFRLRLEKRLLFFTVRKTLEATILLSDLRAVLAMETDASDPEAPKVSRIDPPGTDFQVTVWTDEWYVTLLTLLFTTQINDLADAAVAGAIARLQPWLEARKGTPVPYGTGAPAPVGGGPPTDFLGPALAISKKIQAHHLPHGTVVGAAFHTPYAGTWASLTDPSFRPGAAVRWFDYGDSAIWSGHYLAAEAYRHRVTGSIQAQRNARNMVEAFRVLANLKGRPGLLARAIVPAASRPEELSPPERYAGLYQGTEYVLDDFISRDQYLGALLGLSSAHDFLSDPPARAQAARCLSEMLDYLLSSGWVAHRRDGSVSTSWHLQIPQQLAWTAAGRRMDPLRFGAEHLRHAPLSELAWFTPWLETSEPVASYFKFNLQHGAFHTWLRLETDPVHWERGWKAFRILRRALGHHQNAHFNLCEISAAPWRRESLQGETREELRLWLRRPRRRTNVDLRGIVPTVPYTVTMQNGTSATPVTIASQVVPVDRRPYTDFLWQRPPFDLVSSGDGTEESPAVDYLLPYWMGRYYGVLE